MNLRQILADPYWKTAIASGIASAAQELQAVLAVSHGPWGVLASVACGLLAHNLISKYAPPSTIATKTEAATIAENVVLNPEAVQRSITPEVIHKVLTT